MRLDFDEFVGVFLHRAGVGDGEVGGFTDEVIGEGARFEEGFDGVEADGDRGDTTGGEASVDEFVTFAFVGVGE